MVRGKPQLLPAPEWGGGARCPCLHPRWLGWDPRQQGLCVTPTVTQGLQFRNRAGLGLELGSLQQGSCPWDPRIPSFRLACSKPSPGAQAHCSKAHHNHCPRLASEVSELGQRAALTQARTGPIVRNLMAGTRHSESSLQAQVRERSCALLGGRGTAGGGGGTGLACLRAGVAV